LQFYFARCAKWFHLDLEAAQGDKAEKVTYNNDNSITIVVNGNGNTFHADQSNIIVNKAIFKGTTILNADKEIEGFEVKKQGDPEPLIHVNREELQVFQQPNNKYLDKPDRTTDIKELRSLLKNLMWLQEDNEVYFLLRRPPNSCQHSRWAIIQRIQEGEKFGNGDSLVVDLEISKKYDEGYDTYIIDK